MKNKTIFYLLLLFPISVIGQTTYNINAPRELENNSYVPGDVIILANGTYNTSATIDFVGNGTADNPIVFRAETPGGVKFTGGLQMNIGGDYVVVDGFYWQGGYGSSSVIEFRNGTDYANHSTIQNCAMDGLTVENPQAGTSTKHNWVMLYGTYNTVINCSFMNKTNAGNMILIELAYNYAADPCAIVGHTISNNYFYNYKKIDTSLTNAGDSETIRIGTSSYQMVNSSCMVSNNYFVSTDGENEIISNKSKNNIYTNNTFRRCRGSLVLRHGTNATVDGNYFLGENIDGTGGIRIVDSKHTITNNYIQDCITVVSQAIWNNGITFLGGGTSSAALCTSSNDSSSYQKVENINLSNNTIVNTNAPLFYNTNKGSTDPTGTVSNNLIYFSSGNANITDVISGNTSTSYANVGTSLTYTGNVYTGTVLGKTNAGFSEETEIIATANGEIFTFSGTGSSGKGANMGAYTPITDTMVGNEVGACFLNNLGANITDGNCTIVIPEFLTVGSLQTLNATRGSYDVTVNANVSWKATSHNAWISIDTNLGTGDATVSITVTENTETTNRTGSVTFSQDPGGDGIVRTLHITQKGVAITDVYTLINTGLSDDPVTIDSFSKEEVGNGKTNYASNTLDKNNNTVWAADDGSILANDYKGDGEYIIYDLGNTQNLDFVQFTTTNKADAFGFQIWVSTTGTDVSDFTKVLPATGDVFLTATNTTEFNQYEIPGFTTARYVKLIGYGRFNSEGDTRKSVWSAVGEVEFYKSSTLSIDNKSRAKVLLYPVPVKNTLQIHNLDSTTKKVSLYHLDGRRIIEKTITNSSQSINIDVSSIASGMYMVYFYNESSTFLRMIVVDN